MSLSDVKKFYKHLEETPSLDAEARSFGRIFPDDQEKVMELFVSLGAREGFYFTAEELIRHIYSCGKEEKARS